MTGSKLLPEPELTDHPVDVGQRTEAAILSELVKRGYRILLPFGVNQRYDLVLDLGDRFVRAQCKTGRLRKGAVVFSTASVQSNTRGSTSRGYAEDTDIFLVYCPETERVYAVDVRKAPISHMSLRVGSSGNGQSANINWAVDHELPA